MSDRALDTSIQENRNDSQQNSTTQANKQRSTKKSKFGPIKSKHRPVVKKNKKPPIQAKQTPISRKKPTPPKRHQPESGNLPSTQGTAPRPTARYLRYASALLSRLDFYRRQFMLEAANLYAGNHETQDHAATQTKKQAFQELAFYLAGYIRYLNGKKRNTVEEVDIALKVLIEKVEGPVYDLDGEAIFDAFKAELPQIKSTQGAILVPGGDPGRNLNPADHQNEQFEATRSWGDWARGRHKERDPGGYDSIQASVYELNMPIDAAAVQLYQLLVIEKKQKFWGKSGQTRFIKIARLLARPDVKEVEKAFVKHQANTNGTTLREAIAEVYRLPTNKQQGNKYWEHHWLYRERHKYLFELLDNEGKGVTGTRIAVSLGLMDNHSWKRMITHESEVTRLVEQLKPNELADFWDTYQYVLRRHLNSYNYQRVKNHVAANQNYAEIKATMKVVKGKEDELAEIKQKEADQRTPEEMKLWDEQKKAKTWQENLLNPDKHNKYPFLVAKDRNLEAIIRNYTAGANKYTGKWGVWMFIKGKVKDLKKEVETWIKSTIKEEKDYFGGQPIIRKYVLGETVRFTPTGADEGEAIVIKNIDQFTKHALGEGHMLKALGLSPLTVLQEVGYPLFSYFPSLSLFKSSRQEAGQFWRTKKFGWHAGDRATIKAWLAMGVGAADAGDATDRATQTQEDDTLPEEATRSENPDTDQPLEHIELRDADLSKRVTTNREIFRLIDLTLRMKGENFEPEMVNALSEIAGAAKRIARGTRYQWSSMNRRQDLFKAIMKLPDRWSVQFMDAFVNGSIEEVNDETQAQALVDRALHNIQGILTGVGLLPKQIQEVLGKLRYGSDVTENYLQLRRVAGLANYKFAIRRLFSLESFHPRKALRFVSLLTDKELEIAKRDTQMLEGLERQYAAYITGAYSKATSDARARGFITRVTNYFQRLCDQLNYTPQLDWRWQTTNTGEIDLNEFNKFRKTYQQQLKTDAKANKKWESKTDDSANHTNPADRPYYHYHEEYIGQDSEQADEFQNRRRAQEEDFDSLVTEEEMSPEAYSAKVTEWKERFKNVIISTTSYRKMMQMAMVIWQEGDQYGSKAHIGSKAQKYALTDRKRYFLYQVYQALDDREKTRLKSYTTRNIMGGNLTEIGRTKYDLVGHLEAGDLDMVAEMIKVNYRFYRSSASSRDRAFGEASFKDLGGRVLLDVWTDAATHHEKLKERKEVIDNIEKERTRLIACMPHEIDLTYLEGLEQDLNQLNKEVWSSHIPLPQSNRLEQLRGTFNNKHTYAEMVKSLFLHLSDAVEFDKAFGDAMLAIGYTASDLMILTEHYKNLAAQESEKFWQGAPTWRILTTQSTERREGAFRLLSAMRNMNQTREDGKVHSDLGDDKGYFYDTFFDDVMDRQETFEKTTNKYRKNVRKTVWLLGSLGFVPVTHLFIVPDLAISLAFAMLGTGTTAIDIMLDPHKNTLGGGSIEMVWGAIKSSLTTTVFYLSNELKNVIEGLGGEGSIEQLEEAFGEGKDVRLELLAKSSGEYIMRRFGREIGKEMVKGLKKAFDEGPEEALIEINNALLNPALVFETLLKTGFRELLGDTLLGVTGKVEGRLQDLFDVDADNLAEGQEGALDFATSEGGRTVRRELFKMMGLKKLVKLAEYAVYNRYPLFRTFNPKYDVKRRQPLAQLQMEERKQQEQKIEQLENQILKIQTQEDKIQLSLVLADLKWAIQELIREIPDDVQANAKDIQYLNNIEVGETSAEIILQANQILASINTVRGLIYQNNPVVAQNAYINEVCEQLNLQGKERPEHGKVGVALSLISAQDGLNINNNKSDIFQAFANLLQTEINYMGQKFIPTIKDSQVYDGGHGQVTQIRNMIGNDLKPISILSKSESPKANRPPRDRDSSHSRTGNVNEIKEAQDTPENQPLPDHIEQLTYQTFFANRIDAIFKQHALQGALDERLMKKIIEAQSKFAKDFMELNTHTFKQLSEAHKITVRQYANAVEEATQKIQEMEFALAQFFTVQNNDGKGDCLFKALAYNSTRSHQQARALVADNYLPEEAQGMPWSGIQPPSLDNEKARAYYNGMTFGATVAPKEYQELMGFPGVWGGVREIMVYSRVAQVQVLLMEPINHQFQLFSNGQPHPNYVNVKQAYQMVTNTTRPTIAIRNWGNHYIRLIPKNNVE